MHSCKMEGPLNICILVLFVLWPIYTEAHHLFMNSTDNSKGCKELIDICFVIDGSDSISAPDFEILRITLSEMVDRLHIGEGNGRMGIVVYSKGIAMEVPLTEDRPYLKKKALTMPHPREGTDTFSGIASMTAIFREYGRRGVPAAGVVVTDGISKNTSITVYEATRAKNIGVNMFAVGVGFSDLRNTEELQGIASAPSQVLTVDSFKMLADRLGDIIRLVCPKQCKIPHVHGQWQNCREYWKCVDGKAIRMCCPKGHSYIENEGCKPVQDCVDPCGIEGTNECTRRKVWFQPDVYDEFIRYFGWVRKACPDGTLYDARACQCSIIIQHVPRRICRVAVHIPFDDTCLDKSGNNIFVENHNVKILNHGWGFFDGRSKLVIPHFPEMHNSDFVIKMRFMEFPSRHKQGLLSYGTRDRPAMIVRKSKWRLHYTAVNCFNAQTTMDIPAHGDCWNEAILSHTHQTLEGIVNGVGCKRWTYGPLMKTHGSLQIGVAPGCSNFNGFMDYVTVYYCQPEFK